MTGAGAAVMSRPHRGFGLTVVCLLNHPEIITKNNSPHTGAVIFYSVKLLGVKFYQAVYRFFGKEAVCNITAGLWRRELLYHARIISVLLFV